MKQESIILNVFPLIKDSLLLVSFDELKLPESTDFSSISVLDDKGRKLLFDLIGKKGYIKKFNNLNSANKNHIAIIITRSNVRHIKIKYKLSGKPGKFTSPERKIGIRNDPYLAVLTKNASVLFEKNGYSIEKIKIAKNEYGPLQLVASGGSLFFQKNMRNAKLTIVSDSSIVKIFKVEGAMEVLGDKCSKEGFLPVAITYCFWSPDSKNMFAKAEIELKYDKATDLRGNKLDFINPLIWYRLDNFNKKLSTSPYTKSANEYDTTTLKHPYYAYFRDNRAFFAMCPYLALPNDGVHTEKGKNFFGASWHSMPKPRKPYWANEKEYTGHAQGYYPRHSLRAYWRIGLYFGDGKKDVKNIASVFSYQPKIRNVVHLSSEEVSNAYITRWKYNKKMAFNAITDDAKINDYIYRISGKIPKWVQIAIATRTLFGINYHRFCYIGEKVFCLKRYPLLSTFLSTLLCLCRMGKPLRKKFKQENLSYLPHTNTHPIIYKLDADSIRNEVQKSEQIWIDKWAYGIPLSHIFSYASPYGLGTEKGTMEKAAFSASKHLQWIREWPMPNAPLDFFLPSKLFWGICTGEFFDKNNCKKIMKEFMQRYKNGSDYMIIAGHVPEYGKECPKFITGMFNFFQKHNDVWFADADEIIRYYKARENTIVGRAKKHKKGFLIKLNNKLPQYLSTDITLIQHINKKISRMQFTADKKDYADIKYRIISKNTIIYNVPSNTKYILIS